MDENVAKKHRELIERVKSRELPRKKIPCKGRVEWRMGEKDDREVQE